MRCVDQADDDVTPDSFSDGGAWLNSARAIDHGLAPAAEGADVVGGESTRPGALLVPPPDELSRVLPVVRELACLVRGARELDEVVEVPVADGLPQFRHGAVGVVARAVDVERLAVLAERHVAAAR